MHTTPRAVHIAGLALASEPHALCHARAGSSRKSNPVARGAEGSNLGFQRTPNSCAALAVGRR